MSQAFEEEDLRLLSESMRLRERMMKNISTLPDDQLPRKSSDLMAVTNLLESVDRSVFAKAKIKIEDSSSKSEEATRAVLRSLMVDLHSNGGAVLPALTGGDTNSIPNYASSTDLELNPGELIVRSDNFTPEENE